MDPQYFWQGMDAAGRNGGMSEVRYIANLYTVCDGTSSIARAAGRVRLWWRIDWETVKRGLFLWRSDYC